MAGLGLDQVEVGRAVVSVGAEHREVVREARDADALVGLVAVLVPEGLQVDPLASADRVGGHVAGVEDLEAGREHEHVDRVLGPIFGHDPALGDPLDRCRLERDVVAVEGAQELVMEARPLAPERVAGRQLVAHDWVVHLLREVVARNPLDRRGQRIPAVVVHGEREGQLDDGLAHRARHRLTAGDALQNAPHPRRDRAVELRQAPDRRALEDRQVLDLGGDRRDHLDRGGARADHGDALAAQVQGVVPAGGMERRAGERLNAGYVRQLWVREDAGRVDHVARDDLVPLTRRERPGVRLLVEGRAGDADAEARLRGQPVPVGAVLGIGTQLRAGRVGARPVGPLLERELVAERRDVDGDPRVGVPAPGPAEAVVVVDDQVVADAGLLEADRGADPGEASSDDEHVVIRLRDRHGRASLTRETASRRRAPPPGFEPGTNGLEGRCSVH